ncbi:hypothetical protein T229_01555, partial [Tannerella sp. oral taxon BU063 isolate Cell 5]
DELNRSGVTIEHMKNKQGKVKFLKESDGSKTLHIHIDFRKGGEFVNDAGKKQKAYDTDDKTWLHLNFFQHE